MSPSATYHGGEFDSVDMATGRLHLHIPLVVDHSERGKLDFTYSLAYASTGTWVFMCSTGTCGNMVLEAPKYGVASLAQVTDGLISGATQQSYKDGSGHTNYASSVYELGYGLGPLHPLGNLETIDGSGINLGGGGIDKDGIQFSLTGSTFAEDTDGNKMTVSVGYPTTTVTDTLGRTWTTTQGSTDVSGCPAGGPVAPTSSTIWTIPGPANVNNGIRKFKFCISTYIISATFNWLGSPRTYGATKWAISGVVLPDGTSWRFDYANNSYGDLVAVYPPTGGHISYAWSSLPGGCFTNDAGTRTVLSRTIFDGTNSSTWNYNVASGITTVTDPLNNDTKYTVNRCSGIVTQAQYYSGSSTNGTLLKTIQNGYRDLPDPYPTDLAEGPVPDPQLLTSTTTIWANGEESHYVRTYDSGFTFTDNNPDHNCPCTYTSSYGLVTSESHSDYGNGASGPVLSTKNTTYVALLNSSYATANILDLPSSFITTDGNGNTCSETDYGYDESTPDPSGITEQHGSAPNSVRGNLTSITRQLFTNPCSTSTPSETPLTTTNHVYDTGMVHTMTDPLSHTTTYAYSGTFYGAYRTQTTFPPTSSPNPATHIISGNYDFNSGLLTSFTDQNSNTTSFTYDVMLRPTNVTYPPAVPGQLNGQTNFYYPNTTTVEMKKLIDGTRWTDSFVYYDGLGRESRKMSVNDEALPYDQVDICYDANGRVGFKSYPYSGNGTSTPKVCTGAGDAFTYDPLNRTTQVTHSDSSTVLNSYTGRATSVQDEGNGTQRVQRISQIDGLGRLTSLCEASGSLTVGISGSQTAAPCNLDIGGTGFLTTYTYDPLDNLKSVSQGPLNSRAFSYDSLSRLTITTNPESGTTCYGTVSGTCQQNGYDGNGNLIYRTDARGVLTSYHYDALNREYQTRNYSDSTPTLYFSYDVAPPWMSDLTNVVGRLVEADNQYAGSNSPQAAGYVNSYDAMGRIVRQWQLTPATSPGGNFLYSTYDLIGDLTSSTNGLGLTLNYSVNRAARLTTLTNSATAFGAAGTPLSVAHYNAAGSLLSATLGNGINETRTYDSRLRLNGINDGSRYALTIPANGFAPDSDILLANDSVNGNWTYGYDAFNRLASASATGQSYTYAYDRYGNRWQQNGPHSSQPGFDANNRMVSGLGVTYDAAGNETNDGVTAYTYDAENRIATATNPTTGTSSYVYDASGKRIRKTTVSGGAVDFLYDLAGHEIAQFNSGTWTRGEIYAAGRHLATLSNNTTYYNHADWLGTERARSTSTGAAYETCTSLPFGDWLTCTGGDPSPMHFTGKERDSESGLDNYGARYNSSQYGRFMTPDWSSKPQGVPYAVLDDPQSLNLYSYVGNNPIGRADPDGHCSLCDDNVFGTDGPKPPPPPPPPPPPQSQAQKQSWWQKATAYVSGVVAGAVKTYQTYTKQLENGTTYSGKTSGTGTPEQNVAKRDANGYPSKSSGPAVLDKSSTNPNAIRGREQQLIEANGGAQSQGGTSGNAINGVSPTNPNAQAYENAANSEFGPVDGPVDGPVGGLMGPEGMTMPEEIPFDVLF